MGHVHYAAPASPGDPNAAPALSALPDMVREPAGEAERMHPPLALASEILERRLPDPPDDRSYASLSEWVESTIAPWVEQRRDAIDDVRFQMMRDSPAETEQVLCSTVVGLLQEDTALSLERIPAPAELDREPEVAKMFRDIIHLQARPFMEAALREYAACAKLGTDEGAELERWGRFCDVRQKRLRSDQAIGAAPLAAVTQTVTHGP